MDNVRKRQSVKKDLEPKEDLAKRDPAPKPVAVKGVNRPLYFFAFLLIGTIVCLYFDPQIKAWFKGNKRELKWWQRSIVYQIYPRSFQDSDGDGIGDLKGIQSRLDYFEEIGVGAIWLSPIYKSPMVDFGYDISDFTAIDPMFGTMKDFEKLLKAAHRQGLYVIMDFIPNHTSDQHVWFEDSCKKKGKYKDYYVWHKGKKLENGTRVPPNNWVSAFGGSAWEWHGGRQQFYLHQFAKEQPDLNFRNPKVHDEILKAFKFWLDKGIDGFRVDAIRHMYEKEDFLHADNPPSGIPRTTPDQYEYYDHVHTVNLPEIHPTVKRWRKLFDEHEKTTGKSIFMVVEVFGYDVEAQMKYYHSGADMPFNFNLLQLDRNCNGKCVAKVVSSWLKAVPEKKWSNWVIGNHDVPRISQKMGDDFVSVMNMLLLLLPGTPTTYYGEEIGMKSIEVSYSDTQDPHGKYFGPERYKEFSRDPCRSPMQWSDHPNAGFSTADKLWLPIHPNYHQDNVQVQKQDSSGFSPFQIYKKLAFLRREKTFLFGDIDIAIANDNVFSFIRYIKREPPYLIAVNVGKKVSTDDYTRYSGIFPPRGNFVPNRGYVVLSTDDSIQANTLIDLTRITLNVGQGIIIRFWPKF